MIDESKIKIYKESFFELYPLNLLERPTIITAGNSVQIQDYKTQFSNFPNKYHYYFVEIEFLNDFTIVVGNNCIPFTSLINIYYVLYFKDPLTNSINYKWTYYSTFYNVGLPILSNYTYKAHERYIFPFVYGMIPSPSWILELKFASSQLEGSTLTAIYRIVDNYFEFSRCCISELGGPEFPGSDSGFLSSGPGFPIE